MQSQHIQRDVITRFLALLTCKYCGKNRYFAICTACKCLSEFKMGNSLYANILCWSAKCKANLDSYKSLHIWNSAKIKVFGERLKVISEHDLPKLLCHLHPSKSFRPFCNGKHLINHGTDDILFDKTQHRFEFCLRSHCRS